MSKKLIRVTKRHIDRGNYLDCNACPVALALIDAGLGQCKVGGSTVYDTYWNPKYTISERTTDWIGRFDNCKKVKPFSFYVVSV